MRFLLTAGGTGGHLYPAIAIAEELKKRVPCTLRFVGTRRGIEATVVPQKGYDFRTVWISGFQRRRFWRNLAVPLKMMISSVQALWIVGTYRPDVLIGTGGYASWPIMSIGILLGMKTVIQEQNAVPGVVTRLLAGHVDRVFLSFSASCQYLKENANVRISGNPTREDLDVNDKKKAYASFRLSPARKTLFIFGGSQGARSINQGIGRILGRLMTNDDLQILWAAGPRWAASIQQEVREYRDRVSVFPYIGRMGEAYLISDLVICRAGATTIAEVARLGVPVVFIPLPGAAGGHQEANARILVDAGAAELVYERDFDTGDWVSTVVSLLNDPERLDRMRKNLKPFGRPDAAGRIVDDILDLVRR